MKRIYYYIVGTIILFATVIFSNSVGATSGANKRMEKLEVKARDLFVTLSERYTKIEELHDNLSALDETATALVNNIEERITNFNDTKLLSQTVWPALQDAKYIDENFMTLILYLKDNKDTFGSTLPSSFYTEFDAITSVLLPKINAYNSVTADYNTHIDLFPNRLYLKGRNPYIIFDLALYPENLPLF